MGSLPFDPATVWHQNRGGDRRKRAANMRGSPSRLKSESNGLTVCKPSPGKFAIVISARGYSKQVREQSSSENK